MTLGGGGAGVGGSGDRVMEGRWGEEEGLGICEDGEGRGEGRSAEIGVEGGLKEAHVSELTWTVSGARYRKKISTR